MERIESPHAAVEDASMIGLIPLLTTHKISTIATLYNLPVPSPPHNHQHQRPSIRSASARIDLLVSLTVSASARVSKIVVPLAPGPPKSLPFPPVHIP